jgi:hypothetical protein
MVKKCIFTLSIAGIFLPTISSINDKLFDAVRSELEDISEINRLLVLKADPDARSSALGNPLSALEATCLVGKYNDTIQALLAAGADPNLGGRCIPLETTLLQRRTQSAGDLIKAGANPNVNGSCSLMIAIIKNDSCAVKLLIDAGSNLDSKSGRNFEVYTHDTTHTPLTYAIYHYNPPIVQILLDAGASLTAKDGYGDTALTLINQPAWKQGQIKKKPDNFYPDPEFNIGIRNKIISIIKQEVTKREELLVKAITKDIAYLNKGPLPIPPLTALFAAYTADLSVFPDPKVQARKIKAAQAQKIQAQRAVAQKQLRQEWLNNPHAIAQRQPKQK